MQWNQYGWRKRPSNSRDISNTIRITHELISQALLPLTCLQKQLEERKLHSLQLIAVNVLSSFLFQRERIIVRKWSAKMNLKKRYTFKSTSLPNRRRSMAQRPQCWPPPRALLATTCVQCSRLFSVISAEINQYIFSASFRCAIRSLARIRALSDQNEDVDNFCIQHFTRRNLNKRKSRNFLWFPLPM